MYILLLGSLFVLLFLTILFIGLFAKKEKLKFCVVMLGLTNVNMNIYTL